MPSVRPLSQITLPKDRRHPVRSDKIDDKATIEEGQSALKIDEALHVVAHHRREGLPDL
jgi:hypothetical protein